MQLAKSTYPVLRRQVAQLLAEGRERAQLAVENERVRTYHAIGHLLHEHLPANQNRADYGDRLITQLAGDLKIGVTSLYEALAFYRSASTLYTHKNLGWSHIRALLRAPEERRAQLAARADQHGWSVRELRAHVQAERADQTAPAPPIAPDAALPALRGHLFTYRLVPARTSVDLRLDLGFGIHLAHPLTDLKSPQPDDHITSHKTPEGYILHPAAGRKAAYYSFAARVDHIIDGDTLWLDIDCGFSVWSRQKLRLRGIDAPEIATDEGKRARRFIEDQLSSLPFVVVTTTKPDKFDRYLADVFYLPGATDPNAVLQEGHFLNRDLLDANLAQRYKD